MKWLKQERDDGYVVYSPYINGEAVIGLILNNVPKGDELVGTYKIDDNGKVHIRLKKESLKERQ